MGGCLSHCHEGRKKRGIELRMGCVDAVVEDGNLEVNLILIARVDKEVKLPTTANANYVASLNMN